MLTRVFLKMKNPFLWAGLRNPIVSIYKEPKYQFFKFFGHLLTISTISFLFWVFIRGNWPKMSLKYAIFKICPKFAWKWYSCETRVCSTNFGESWRQKVVSVFGFGHPKSHFFAPENGHFQWFWVSPTIPQYGGKDYCFTWISFPGEFWANFENRVF